MNLPEPIASGMTAQVYAWRAGQILKLFNRGISRGTVEYEAELSRLVHASGLPVPAVGEVIDIDGRFGVEYERVEGITMLEALMKQPWKFAYFARLLAGLQADMHQHRLPGMPSLMEILARKISRASLLPGNVRQAALDALEQLPLDDKLCHGDFHPNNVLMTAQRPVIIDWIDASQGSPILDVARSTILIAGGPIPARTPHPRLINLIRRWFYLVYRGRYFQLNPVARRQLSCWIPVAAAARLDENIHADEGRLLSIAKRLIP